MRPNILFLLTDDQRWDTLGVMGNPVVQTPHVDRIARRGVTFENHFVTTAICVSSRASTFTGLYTRCHGAEDFACQFTQEEMGRTYPGLLRAAGYRMGFIGKWGLDKAPAPSGWFDYWRGFLGQGKYFPNGENGPHLTRIMADQAREFLAASKAGEPWCLSVSFKAPHVQDEDPRQFLYDPQDEGLYRDVTFPTPKTMDERYISALPLAVQRSEGRRRWAVRFSTPALYQESVRNYYRLITGVDRAVGAMVNELEKLGMLEKTLIAFMGDNGFYLGEHGLAGKWLMHEESIRVPLVVAGPGVAAGRRERRMTLNIDVAPTLAGAAGVTPPVSVQGRDLWPLLRGEGVDWRKDWFYEHRYRSGGWIPATEGVRTERWKYTRYIDEQPVFEELFDLERDPHEERNLAREAGHRGMLETLRERHAAWVKALAGWRVDRRWEEPSA